MKELIHQRIIANAGSGKTYRLTSRYIELLMREIPAEKIIALTFTRKAAGEFLDAIFERLIKVAEGERDGQLDLTAEQALGHLRVLVNKLPQLSLGTLDGFMGRIIRAFSFECGLAGDLTILDEHLQGVIRRKVLSDVFRRHTQDEEGFREFLDLVRQQNRNREGRMVTDALDREIQNLHEDFLMTPAGQPWGLKETIWPEGCALMGDGNLGELATALEQELWARFPDMEEKYQMPWAQRINAIRQLREGSYVPEKLVEFALSTLEPKPAAKIPESFVLKIGNKQFAFPNSFAPTMVELGRAILRVELEGRMSRSKALFELIARFEEPYQARVRDAGQLTFLDITGLLAAAGGATWGGKPLRKLNRFEIDFRLDAVCDHWLLDEFQDTSRLQWQALKGLVDEVIQSDSGQRSFFYVGDTKQAIYAWRGGDPRLFDEIAEHYNQGAEERINTTESLAESRRSSPEILEGVNRIFTPANLAAQAEELEVPEAVLGRWESAWCEHRAYEKNPGGYLHWATFEAPREEKKAVLDEEAARLIGEIDPLGKGLSCAVLVRSNARIITVTDALRRAGIPATSEGRFQPCVDNDLGAALISLLRAVAHPGDTLAVQHVSMTPLRVVLGDEVERFRVAALQAVRDLGFYGLVDGWLKELNLSDNLFAERRAEDFLEAASKFDAAWGGKAGFDDFIAYAQSYSGIETPAAGAVRVLTVHASKGLDFDMVVLPDLEGDSLPSRRDETLHLQMAPEGEIEWAMELPPRKVCQADPVLRQAWDDDVVKDCYENFCFYYVALTRAKRGMYLLTSKLGTESKARDFNRLLHETFLPKEDVMAWGDAAWHEEGVMKNEAVAQPEIEALAAEVPEDVLAMLPSAHEARPIRAAAVLAGDGTAAGTAVHRALAGVLWLGEAEPEGNLREFFEAEDVRRIFTKPKYAHWLWIEKAFDVRVDGAWIRGTFDRVVIKLDALGQPESAAIYDFKTGKVVEAYREQMGAYRKGLAGLLGIEEGKVTAALVTVPEGREVLV
ncbi:UvrD-helicase domain-containing protein [soil metagenome]